MPARKSDARRSDVSVARFVLADDDRAVATEPAAPEPAAPPASSATPAPAGAQTSPQERKDKEKEKEKEKDKERDAITIEDLTLPKSIITRLAKGVLPPNTQIQANAILALSKSAVVFINHLAASANEFTLSSNKKTIMPADVFKALDEIEYGFMRERVEAEFAKFNEVQTSKRSTYRKKVAAAKKAAATGEGSSMVGDASMLSMGSAASHDVNETDADGGAGQSRVTKKPRIDRSEAGDDSRMEVDDHDPSDAETVPEEPDEEEEEDEEQEEEDDDEEEEGEEEADEEADEAEDRAAHDEDEALDDEDSD